ncbi:nucleoside 2-deoxyribosyltransferase [Candidatus Woesearchaeota archaeon]|nr:nucleoside 2-deoxyribosyltransferase [Candidatus Woesearchaeota archaeon]
MNIYFAGSITGGREDVLTYSQIIQYLKNYGNVLDPHVGNVNLTSNGENLPDFTVFDRNVNYIQNADVIIAEVSTPSLGVGYELCLGEILDKKVLCLNNKSKNQRLSRMISGNPKFQIAYYSSVEEAFKSIDDFFSS